MNRVSFLAGLAAVAFPVGARGAGLPSLDLRLTRDGILYQETFAVFLGQGTAAKWWLNETGYRRLCYAMRDERAGVAVTIAPMLFYVLHGMQQRLFQEGISDRGIPRPILITDGYRTRNTNMQIEGAAKNSQHMHACAADFAVDGVSMDDLFAVAAITPGAGGLGLYRDHVHLDTRADGTECSWEGNHSGCFKSQGGLILPA